MNTYSIAVIPGDGVGVEVIPEGLRVPRRAGELTGSFRCVTTDYPWSCQWYLEHGRMMPEDGIARLHDSDAIYLGAVGFPAFLTAFRYGDCCFRFAKSSTST